MADTNRGLIMIPRGHREELIQFYSEAHYELEMTGKKIVSLLKDY